MRPRVSNDISIIRIPNDLDVWAPSEFVVKRTEEKDEQDRGERGALRDTTRDVESFAGTVKGEICNTAT